MAFTSSEWFSKMIIPLLLQNANLNLLFSIQMFIHQVILIYVTEFLFSW